MNTPHFLARISEIFVRRGPPVARYRGGHVPFGYKRIGMDLFNAPKEQKVIREMIQMRTGGATLRSIAYTVTKKGFRKDHSTVRRIIIRNLPASSTLSELNRGVRQPAAYRLSSPD